jgi:hypothetical protein
MPGFFLFKKEGDLEDISRLFGGKRLKKKVLCYF